MTEEICFYAVRSKDGKFFRAKGFGGSGESWVTDLTKARIYARLGPAKSIATFYAKNYSTFGVPVVVKLVVGSIEELDQTDRIKKVQEAEQKRVAKAAVEEQKRKIKQAEEDLKIAQERLQKLKGK